MDDSVAPAPRDQRVPVTLNCSGGVSLGAFMAGVFTELVKASLGCNGLPARLRIDTITGASAGAMTGLIAAWYLLSGRQRAEQELGNDQDETDAAEPAQRNRFHDAWVRRIDIRHLSACDDLLSAERPLGLLNSGIIERIAAEVARQPEPPEGNGPPPLALIMTVTNLQGYLKDPEQGGLQRRSDYRSVTHAETRRFLFSAGAAAAGTHLADLWAKARETALASGAFPVAFPPRVDVSSADSANLSDICRASYDGSASARAAGLCLPTDGGSPRFRFHYTDGGVLDGLPILKGIGFLNQLLSTTAATAPGTPGGDASRQLEDFRQAWIRQYGSPGSEGCIRQEEQRLFVYVKPAPITEIHHDPRLTQRLFTMLQSGLAGLTYPKEEHDELRLSEIRRINGQVRARKVLIRRAEDVADAAQRQELLDGIHTAIPYRQVNLQRISPLEIFQGVGYPRSFRNRLLAALRRRGSLEELQALLATPPQGTAATDPDANHLLACDWLGAFGGFFSRAQREHDYLIGRLAGLAWLSNRNLIDTAGSEAQLEQLLPQLERRFLPESRRQGVGLALVGPLLLILLVRLPWVLVRDHLHQREARRTAA